ncbi:hypothetical protein [Aureibacter tunicatorum]|uniref:DUF4185 domain-containing protein n=1 Tax=Aureibacter tunicatorum TaxID=866807 RepID=A0AAE3XJH8_9BACT|nr:hypothetical protein [Aureibacter tunicatorum]MDR6237284.1 hypothetical protein [Aureibacter tunicatorum]BDD06275.1 hypothetical protein AUTU_37580 [Aureibacter tunicatorum]
MRLNFLFCALALASMFSCQNSDSNNSGVEKSEELTNASVYIDSAFTKMFMSEVDGQITGADGTYSIPLSDGRSLFLFGDSFLDKVVDNTREEKDPPFIHNSFMILDGLDGGIKPIFNTLDGHNEAIAEPFADDHWYWPGTGFEKDGKLYVFMSEFFQRDPNSIWGFEWLSTDLLVYSLEDFSILERYDIPYSNDNGVHYGHAVVEDGEFVYIYGAQATDEGNSVAHVARAKQGSLEKDWEFFDGSGWNDNPMSTQPMGGLSTVQISEQFNVVKMKDSFVLLTQQRGIGEPDIYTFTSDEPFGNWDNKVNIYRTTEQDADSTVYTYNAMIHPQLEKDGRILVSYNVNTLVFEDLFTDASIYRPRFISVPTQLILGDSKSEKI